MARQSRGKSEHCDWFFLDWDFAIWIVSVEMVISCVFFCFQKPTNSKFGAKASAIIIIINYLLTSLARAILGNIGPQSFLYRTH